MSASLPNIHPAYQVGSTTLSTPSLAAATPAPAPTPPNFPYNNLPVSLPQQIAAAEQILRDFPGGNFIISLVNPAAGAEPIPTAAQVASGGASGTSNQNLAQTIVQDLGQAILGVFTTIGHGIANAIVALLQWTGGLAKTHVLALAVAGVVLLMLFR